MRNLNESDYYLAGNFHEVVHDHYPIILGGRSGNHCVAGPVSDGFGGRWIDDRFHFLYACDGNCPALACWRIKAGFAAMYTQ